MKAEIKYELGEEVKVEFIGKIVETSLKDGQILFKVYGDGTLFAGGLSKNQLTPLETI